LSTKSISGLSSFAYILTDVLTNSRSYAFGPPSLISFTVNVLLSRVLELGTNLIFAIQKNIEIEVMEASGTNGDKEAVKTALEPLQKEFENAILKVVTKAVRTWFGGLES
jgi:hypothetical protein